MKNKLTRRDKSKITARYNQMLEHFEKYDLEELKSMFASQKMSSTDRYALIHVVDVKLQAKMVEESKSKQEDIEGE